MIGGQAIVIKHKYGLARDEMLFPGAPRSIKFASGENPKRVYGGREQLPSTRMGNFEVQREALVQAQDYMREWDAYNEKVKRGDKDASAPEARLEARSARRRAARQADGADPLLSRRRISDRNRAWRTSLATRFARSITRLRPTKFRRSWRRKISRSRLSADWWGYKQEAWDAIPWNAVMAMRKGVRVAIKSDSEDYTRRLNQEAAKTIRYGGATEEEALKMITLNAAWIVGVDDRVGSIDVGKDADLVIWDGYPLSSYGVPEKVLIDGEVYFDRSLPGLGMTHYQGGTMKTQFSVLGSQFSGKGRFLAALGMTMLLGLCSRGAGQAPGSQGREVAHHHARRDRERRCGNAGREDYGGRRSRVRLAFRGRAGRRRRPG